MIRPCCVFPSEESVGLAGGAEVVALAEAVVAAEEEEGRGAAEEEVVRMTEVLTTGMVALLVVAGGGGEGLGGDGLGYSGKEIQRMSAVLYLGTHGEEGRERERETYWRRGRARKRVWVKDLALD